MTDVTICSLTMVNGNVLSLYFALAFHEWKCKPLQIQTDVIWVYLGIHIILIISVWMENPLFLKDTHKYQPHRNINRETAVYY